MTQKDEALKKAIEQIKWADHLHDWHDGLYEALEACKAALSKPEQVSLHDGVVDKSAPKSIWLVIGEGDGTYSSALNSSEEICWCADKQYENDVKYIRADLVTLPDGWVAVPVEPTMEMLMAGCDAGLSIECLIDDSLYSTDKATYKAMLQAAPTLNEKG